MSEKKYTPAIVQINFDFTSFEKTQNLESIEAGEIELQSDVELINPLVVAQYALYNRELEDENFGLDDNDYLGYAGGFLTVDDKVNSKINPFSILGNFSIYNKTEFERDIFVRDPRINANRSVRNLFQYNTSFVNIYANNSPDKEALSVGDFRRGTHHRGMIMMWSGTLADLETNLPYWRLCAPPDSDSSPDNTVTIPNLLDTFIISANYRNADNESYDTHQPIDNDFDTPGGRNFGSSIRLNVGTTGGFNEVSLSADQMPTHRHDVNFEVSNPGSFSVTGSLGLNPYVGGGRLTNILSATAKARCLNAYSCVHLGGCSNKYDGPNTACPLARRCGSGNGCASGATYFRNGYSVKSNELSDDAFPEGTIGLTDEPITVTQLEETNRGIASNHENRPDFYVLAYIIYVGVKRN